VGALLCCFLLVIGEPVSLREKGGDARDGLTGHQLDDKFFHADNHDTVI
jgi:hypothetical protein